MWVNCVGWKGWKTVFNQDLEGLEAFCCLYVVYGELKMCMHANFEVLNVFFFFERFVAEIERNCIYQMIRVPTQASSTMEPPSNVSLIASWNQRDPGSGAPVFK